MEWGKGNPNLLPPSIGWVMTTARLLLFVFILHVRRATRGKGYSPILLAKCHKPLGVIEA